MKRIIRLTERDLTRIVKRVLQEEVDMKSLMTKDEQIDYILNVNNVNPKIIGSDATIEWNNASGTKTEVRYDENGKDVVIYKIQQRYSFNDGEEINVNIKGCEVTPGTPKKIKDGIETNHLVNCRNVKTFLGGNYELANDAVNQPLKVIFINSEIKDADSDVV